MSHYANVLGRSRVLHKNIEALIRRNEELELSNKKLRAEMETLKSLAQARERVFKSLEVN